jgi:hypothetical protein
VIASNLSRANFSARTIVGLLLMAAGMPAAPQNADPKAGAPVKDAGKGETTQARSATAEEPRVNTSTNVAQPVKHRESSKTMDRLDLDPSAITGNRELPKVLYIVPWKKSDLGDLVGRPANSLLDEVLAPVDREVFRRQTEYFTKLNADAAAQAASKTKE